MTGQIVSRRGFIAGGVALATLTLGGGVAWAARPTVTVYRDPT
jgi:hypothetical protein